MIDQYKNILEQLKAATKDDRRLDILIATTMDGMVLEKRRGDKKAWLYRADEPLNFDRKDVFTHAWNAYPRLTRSIDDAMAFVKRLLPGWDKRVEDLGEDGGYAQVWEHGLHSLTSVSALHSSSASIALLIATIKAKIKEMENG